MRVTAIECKIGIFDGLANYGKDKKLQWLSNFTYLKELLNYILYEIIFSSTFEWEEAMDYKLKAQNYIGL